MRLSIIRLSKDPKSWQYGMFVACALIFALLLAKNPFSERTLIPNFDPHPDVFHYVTSARSLLAGDGLTLTREGRSLNPSVPPLYSITLIPGFLIYNDPRIFYFTNVFLSFVSFTFFYLILKKLITNIWIIGFALFLYITNYFIYWYPTLAMAENLLLTLFLASLLLLLSKNSINNSLFAGLVAVSFYATKKAAAPLTIIFFLFFLIKVILSRENRSKLIKYNIFFCLSFFVSLIIFDTYNSITRQVSIPFLLSDVISLVVPISKEISSSSTSSSTETSWFSLSYVSKNLPQYLGALRGQSMRFLWDFTPIIPVWVGVLGLFGLITGLFYKSFRFLCFALLFLLFGQIFFISTFYAADARFIYHAIPTLILGFSLSVFLVYELIKNQTYIRYGFYIFLLMTFIFYLSTNAFRLKKQIMLNLKYAETPWSYVSIKKLNGYFTTDKIENNKKPVVISALPPYLIDFYSNGNYMLLPLSKDQEFRSVKEIVWGPNDYADLPKLYKSKINEGYPVYVAKYGLGNEGYLHAGFKAIEERFNLTEVVNDCFEVCNVYKLRLRE